jgi:Leucine-rich repeat (LRR) protein
MDLSNTYYTITCASPLTADQVLGAFSQTPINSNIRQLTIRNISGSNDDYMNQIINRIASSQYSLTILVLDQVNITTIPTGVKLFPNLILLSLANNKLQSLSRGSLNVTSNLEVIGLQNNNLTNIEPGTFEGKRLIITFQTQRKNIYEEFTYDDFVCH